MSHFLVVTPPAPGHVVPAHAIVRGLIQRGHRVSWATGFGFKDEASSVGAEFHDPSTPWQPTPAELEEIASSRGVRSLERIVFHALAKPLAAAADRLREIHFQTNPDAVVASCYSVAALVNREAGLGPLAVIGDTPFSLSGPDIAPFGLGLPPRAQMPPRRARAADRLAQCAYGELHTTMDEQRAQLNLPPLEISFFDLAVRRADLFLQLSVESFEYSRSDLPPHVRFIGAPAPDPAPDRAKPEWWHELDSTVPVVLVTQGTYRTNPAELVIPALRGLANEPVLVVVTNPDLAQAGKDEWPSNARVVGNLPYAELMPKVDVFVTNGGYGSLQIAMMHGVPMVVAGDTEEKGEACRRVGWSGVGIDLNSGRPAPDAIRDAVREVLNTPGFRRRAGEMQREFARHDAVAEACDLLNNLATNTPNAFKEP